MCDCESGRTWQRGTFWWGATKFARWLILAFSVRSLATSQSTRPVTVSRAPFAGCLQRVSATGSSLQHRTSGVLVSSSGRCSTPQNYRLKNTTTWPLSPRYIRVLKKFFSRSLINSAGLMERYQAINVTAYYRINVLYRHTYELGCLPLVHNATVLHNVMLHVRALQVNEGLRLPVPRGAPSIVAKIMKACCHRNPSKRPSFLLISTLLSTRTSF